MSRPPHFTRMRWASARPRSTAAPPTPKPTRKAETLTRASSSRDEAMVGDASSLDEFFVVSDKIFVRSRDEFFFKVLPRILFFRQKKSLWKKRPWKLKVVSRKKIIHYRQLYIDRSEPIAFMPVAYDDFLRLLFLPACSPWSIGFS